MSQQSSQQPDTETTSLTIAGDAAVLARRYAKALYELAEEQSALDEVAAELRLLKTLGQTSAEFKQIMKHPRLTRAELVKVVRKITETGKLNVLTGNFLALVAQNRRLVHLSAMVDAFLAELAQRRNEFTAEVRTTQMLSEAQHEQLTAQLRQLAGGKVHLIVEEDTSLLGGLVVKLGSRLIDASVKSKLARLERQLKTLQGAA